MIWVKYREIMGHAAVIGPTLRRSAYSTLLTYKEKFSMTG
jgi:hypothetical protein